jgi:hypothetical protein
MKRCSFILVVAFLVLTVFSVNTWAWIPKEGCTPGYWKQTQHFDSWCTDYAPTDLYKDVFGVTPSFGDLTLLQVLKQGGGGEIALARHAVAALLNACYSLDFYSPSEVISMVQGAYASGDFESAKNILEYANELGCPLN